MKRKIFGMVIVLCMFMAFVPYVRAAGIIANGSCGVDASWILDGEGVLTISGSGNMDFTTWYSYHDDIKRVVIEDGITSIASYAFESCSNLTSISIPDSVTSIGNGAFYECQNLSDINLPDTIELLNTTFNDTAIYNNEANWDNGVLYIGNHLVGSKADEMGENLVVRDGTKTIAEAVFIGNTRSLVHLTLPDSLVSIGDRAFCYCPNLASIDFSDGLKIIGTQAFCECSSLKEITLPESVISIGSSAFSGCTNLKDITLPNHAMSIGEHAFPTLDNSNRENGALYINNHLIAASQVSEEEYAVKQGTKSIAQGAFHHSGLKRLIIPDSVENICDDSIDGYYNENLIEISVDKNNKYYSSENGVLFNKDKTKLIIYPPAKADTTYTIPNSVKELGSSAFEKCNNLVSVKIPNGIKIIDTFGWCENLKNLNIPDSVMVIGGIYMTGLESIVLPEGVKYIRRSAVSGVNFKNVVLPKGLEFIGIFAFDYHSGKFYVYKDSLAYQYCLDCSKYFILRDEPSYTVENTNVQGGNVEIELMPKAYTNANILAISYNDNIPKNASVIEVNTTMSESDVSDNTIMFGECGNISVPIDTTDSENVKIFIWDSLTGMRPLCEPVTVNISGE